MRVALEREREPGQHWHCAPGEHSAGLTAVSMGAERELLCRAMAGLEVRVTEHWLCKQLGLSNSQNSCRHSSDTGIKPLATPC